MKQRRRQVHTSKPSSSNERKRRRRRSLLSSNRNWVKNHLQPKNVVDVRQKKIKSGKRCHLKQVTDLFSLKICNPVCCRWPLIYIIYNCCRWVKQTEQAVQNLGVCKERLFLNTFSSLSNAERIKNVLFVLVMRHLDIIESEVAKRTSDLEVFFEWYMQSDWKIIFFLKRRIKKPITEICHLQWEFHNYRISWCRYSSTPTPGDPWIWLQNSFTSHI